MKTDMIKISAVALLAGLAAFPVLADGGRGGEHRGAAMGERIGEMIQAADADGDGVVTRAEFDAHRAARFAEVDANGDGALSREEARAAAIARAVERAERNFDARFERLDADGDGMIGADAAMSGREGRLFAALDANDDGAVTAEEIASFEPRRGGRHGGGRGWFGGRHGG